MSKPRLGHDPFKDEPLSFIRDTRKDRPRPVGRQKGNIRNTGNIGNTEIKARAGTGKRGRPKGSGTKDPGSWKRFTFIVRRELLEKVKALAYWERLTVTDVLDRALESYLKGKNTKAIRSK